MTEKWEYKILTMKLKKVGVMIVDMDAIATEKKFNELGAQGWEAFQIVPSPPDMHVAFKRRLDSLNASD